MKNHSKLNKISRYIIAFGLVSCLPMVGRADTLIFSTPSGTTPITDGSGTLSSTSTIFYDSTTSTASVAPGVTNILQFGGNNYNGTETGSAGTITVSGTVDAGGLTFGTLGNGTTASYTFSGGTGNSIAFQGAAPTITVASGGSEILNVGITTASGSILAIQGQGTGTTQVSFGSSATGNIGNSTNNSFGGGLSLSNYVLLNAESTGLSGLTSLSSTNSSTIRYYDGTSFSTSTNYTIAGTGDNSGRGALSFYGGNAVTATLNGTITLSAAAQINARDAVVAKGNISGAYALTLETELNSTSYTLNGNNSGLTGGLILLPTVGEETVKVGTGSTSALGTGLVNVSAPAGGLATQIDLNGQSTTVGGLTSGDSESFIGNSAATTTSTLTLAPASAQSFGGVIEDGTTTATYSSSYTNTQNAGGKTALTISSGKQTLSGANTYTGATTINSGATLALASTGSLAAGGTAATSTAIEDNGTFDVTAKTSGLTLGAGQELAGSGSVKGQINLVSGSMINPGSIATAGTLTLNNGLDVMAPGAMLNFRLNTTSTSDLLAIAGGALTESLGTIINLSNGGSFAGLGTYNLLDATAIGVGDITLGDYTLGTTIAGYTEMLVVNGNDNILQLQVTAAPEPGVLSMLAGGGLLLVLVATHRRFKFRV